MQHEPIPPLSDRERRDSRGRVRVLLPKGHPYANSAGWQYRSRFVVMQRLGRKLSAWEHVHHANREGNRADDRLENLEVVQAWMHGRAHGYAVSSYRQRRTDGTWGSVIFEDGKDEAGQPVSVMNWPRFGPILGPEAKKERSRCLE
jgi:hypothetical protein